jgi:hypothetical protein
VLAEKNPSRYGLLYAYTDEVYLSLQLVLERYYLKHYSELNMYELCLDIEILVLYDLITEKYLDFYIYIMVVVRKICLCGTFDAI